ncbi:MAG: ImmA/IrrE family metallo-endopeptidase [Planctomycetia bacterium]|nr:ImmA/IrrE family metallo-endopeptidase [Planctomycetia bacterium]
MKLFRRIKGLTQADLALQSGISVPCIKKIEGGRSHPEVQTLMALGKSLGHKTGDFLQQFLTIEAVRFRSQKKLRSRDMVIDDIDRWLRNYQFIEEETDQRSRLLLKKPSKAICKDMRTLAEYLRKEIGLDEASPIIDPCLLLEKIGIKVLFYDTTADFFGLSINDKNCGQAIVINSNDRISVERKIFTAFHELGHLILHLDSFQINKENENAKEEMEADEFAGYFLMPKIAFRDVWNGSRGIPFVDRVLKVKRYFGVSYKTILKRLIDERVTDDKIWMKFNYEFNKRYHENLKNHREPLGMEPKRLVPSDFLEDRLSRLTLLAVQNEKISISRGAEILGISVTELYDLMQNTYEVGV